MALQPALQPALQSGVSSFWSDGQIVAGSVATPEFPGPITEDHGNQSPVIVPGSAFGPPSGTSASVTFFEAPVHLTDIAGDVGNIGPLYGHEAPMASFDSNAGEPFAQGSGPIAAEVHEFDTGGEYEKFHVIEPKVGRGWWRRILTGQTFNRQAQLTDTKGWQINTPNDRQDLDQYQGHDANAYDPYWVPYSERAIYLNVAHEPVPFGQDTTGAYAPGGDLGPVGPQFWTNESVVYETPPLPQALPASSQQSQVTTSAVGFWG